MGFRWRFPILSSLAVVAFMILADTIFLPFHEDVGGVFSGTVNGVCRMLQLPGLMVAESFGARFRHHTGWAAWFVMLGVSIPLYFMLAVIVRRIWGTLGRSAVDRSTVDLAKSEASTDSQAAPTPPHPPAIGANDAGGSALLSRRGLFIATRRAALAGAAGTAGYAFLGELQNVQTTRRTIGIRNLPVPLAGLKIVQLTDIHYGPWTSLEYIRKVIASTNALDPDLIVLTGDYVHQSDVYIEPVVKELGRLQARIGVLATLGNHDWWESGPATATAFGRTPIRLIDNDRVYLTAERTLTPQVGRSDSAICIAGVGDLWEGSPDYENALAGLPQAMPRLLLSHNPDVAEERPLLKLSKSIDRIDLMLSGHTHGGQISLPGVGTLVTPSKYGNRYAVGLVQGPLGPVYINRGIGTTIIPMRLGVPPEIAVIELQPT